ncbi:hypothetical protein A946_07800 [Methylacidiphilum kamchatkense Kam1]|uniref:DUF3868 domain-containing protein n=1 Tax=Methylacidiphilum kamchatkense Kam1 TaxID=1202785 RepID=A0A0C1UPQ0_9BACT|nr:hypothetical protein [Methylacidiphilum kamchatkense]KIE58379.1 hypothetical protein A946_07800 [Methylacidiphilum kamchatkense Kam1]QDQ42215.1 hypothetical protein kam1_983 [Methylacidiphilum kamchatkense Kam1]
MKPFLNVFLFVFLFVLEDGLFADSPSLPLGAVIKNFILPQRNAEGKLQATIHGEEAVAVSVNRIEIRKMKIELFDNDRVTTTILSPRCDFWKLDNRLSTKNGAEIERKDLKLTSNIMDWEIDNRKGIFRENVRMVLYKLPLGKSNQKKEPSSPSHAPTPSLRTGALPLRGNLETKP